MKNRILRFPEIVEMLGVTRQSIYDMIKRGDFPPSFKITENGRAVGWLESDITKWLESRVVNDGGEK